MSAGVSTHWRVFCAVGLPEGVRAAVAERVARLRAEFQSVRASWERAEKLHLTLKFVGEIELPRVADLTAAAGRAAERSAPFRLRIEGAGAFPPQGPPRVLWLGVADASGGLAALHANLERECEAAGFDRDARAFRPHLTLARLRVPRDARELADAHRDTPFAPQQFSVDELFVMRSELGPGGARHTPVSRHRL
jgi:2'-5' RNA ligase